ncbi:MAG: hypothetical protein AB2693_13585 [Candidatus Thiodiazotropha sp.]
MYQHPLTLLFLEMAHACDVVDSNKHKKNPLKVLEIKLLQFMKSKNIPPSGKYIPEHQKTALEIAPISAHDLLTALSGNLQADED